MNIIDDIVRLIRRPSPKQVGGEMKSPFLSAVGFTSVNASDILDSYKDRAETVGDIKAVLEHLDVRRNLEAVEQRAFSGWGIKAIPPEDYNGNDQKRADEEKEIINRLWEFNKQRRSIGMVGGRTGFRSPVRGMFAETLVFRYQSSVPEMVRGQRTDSVPAGFD